MLCNVSGGLEPHVSTELATNRTDNPLDQLHFDERPFN
jgi:hypothetical protein